ncbi:hypothetical protein [Cellvibrio sp. UBA7671]|uniref:hypothetical protein n=1 Tax=Cellvibrio sp. UBA7671 TaxID=1946312 RepID=UPI002F354C87
MYNFTTPLLEVAPYATFCILLLMVFSTLYLRSQILKYAEKNLPQCFTEFKLYEEQQEDTTSLALYRYIMSNTFLQTNDPVFIALCQRYIRWGQLFILFFVAAIADIDFINAFF